MSEIKVMVNGLPGNMPSKVVEHILRHGDMELLPYSLTGPEIEQQAFFKNNLEIILIKPEHRIENLGNLLRQGPFISVDFTHPSAVISNAEFYVKNNFNFVMGTTGGDRQKLEGIVRDSNICAVIAPNMAKQIVAFQAMVEYAATNFPDVFSGYDLTIQESHQQGKADTSGTARAMLAYFKILGNDLDLTKLDNLKLDNSDIKIQLGPNAIFRIVRNEDTQLGMGVPKDSLTGHGWHTYTLTSQDGTVLFKFVHNVNGRDIYAAGAIDAVRYLNGKMAEGRKGQVYSMIDVLSGK